MLTSGKFLVSFEVPGPLPGTTEGFCEEMIVVYRTEELNPYLRYPKQEINFLRDIFVVSGIMNQNPGVYEI